mgnify:FL=1
MEPERKFPPEVLAQAAEDAANIESHDEWDYTSARDLCELAGIGNEYDTAFRTYEEPEDTDSLAFEKVVFAAVKALGVTVTDNHVDTRAFCNKCHNLIDGDGHERRPGCGEPVYCEWCWDKLKKEYKMNIYRIYEYKACVKIPRGMRNDNGAYTADEVETIVMEDAYKGDCFLHDDPIFTTKDKAEAEAKFEELKSKASTEVGYQWITNAEALGVTCYGIEELTYDVAYWGEPEDDDELLERAESVGENWTFAGVEAKDEEDDEDEDE